MEITDSDLTIKKQDKSYDSGKANPFAAASASASDNTTNTSGGNTNTGTSTNPDSTDHFFNNNGGIK